MVCTPMQSLAYSLFHTIADDFLKPYSPLTEATSRVFLYRSDLTTMKSEMKRGEFQ